YMDAVRAPCRRDRASGTFLAPRFPQERSHMRRLLALCSVSLPAVLSACGGNDAPVVGVLLPMTGDTATYGEESWNGIQIAYADIKAKDPSFPLKLELADEQSKKDQVGPQTKRLIENSGARIVVGSVASSNTMEAAIVCKN